MNWTGVGQKIGYWINAGVQTAYWFLKTVDFFKLGEHVAELVNGALEEVDTSFIGRIIVRWFTLKFDFILGALGALDWGLLARKVSDCIKGAFDEATEWLNSYDWSQMGKDLWANIKAVISNIDWGGIAKSIFTFLGTAIRSVAQFLGGFFREGSNEDAFRLHAAFIYEINRTLNERIGLARSRTCRDEDGAVCGGYRFSLSFVRISKIKHIGALHPFGQSSDAGLPSGTTSIISAISH